MANDLELDGGRSVAKSTALTKFAEVFESFTHGIEIWKNSLGPDLEETWSEYFGPDSPSLVRELEEVNLIAMERQLKILTLLLDLRLEEIKKTSESDPFSQTKEINELRSKAEMKLMHLYDKIKSVRNRLGSGNGGSSIKMKESPQQAKSDAMPSVVEVEGAGPVEIDVEQQAAKDVRLSFGKIRKSTSAVSKSEIAKLETKLVQYRRFHKDAADIQINTATKQKSLSLSYFEITGKSSVDKKVLDLENFIRNQKLALREIINSVNDSRNSRLNVRNQNILTSFHNYFVRLYSNVRKVLADEVNGCIPECNETVTADLLLVLEANLHFKKWYSISDIREFHKQFEQLMDPFENFMVDIFNKRNYLLSILST